MQKQIESTLESQRVHACNAVESLRTDWAAALSAIKQSTPALTEIPPNYNLEDYNLVCQYGDVAALKNLIAGGFNIQTDDNLALRWMAHHGKLKMVEFLLGQGADIHANEDVAVQWAASNGQTAMVRLLIERGADIQANNNLAVHWAAEKAHFDTVALLNERGASLERLTSGERGAYDSYRQERIIIVKHTLRAIETLTEIFKASTWVGHVPEMIKLWEQVPEPLQAGMDFQHRMAEAKVQSLKQKTKPRILVTK